MITSAYWMRQKQLEELEALRNTVERMLRRHIRTQTDRHVHTQVQEIGRMEVLHARETFR